MQPNARYWYLKRLGTNNFQKFLPLTSDLVTIGRSNHATFHIKSKYLSRKPCALRFDEDHWTLIANRDADITLYVNHYKVFKGEECALIAGDKIGFGVPINFANEESSAVYEFCENLLVEENNPIEMLQWSCLDSELPQKSEESIQNEELKKRIKVIPRMCLNICSDDEGERESDQKQKNETCLQLIPQETKLNSCRRALSYSSQCIPAVAESHLGSHRMEPSGCSVVTEPHSGSVSYSDKETLMANESNSTDISVSSNVPVIVSLCHVNISDFEQKQNEGEIQLHVGDQESLKHDTTKNENQSCLLEDSSSENHTDIHIKELALYKEESASTVSTEFLPVQQAENVLRCDGDLFKALDHTSNTNDPRPLSRLHDSPKCYKDYTSKTHFQKQHCMPCVNSSQKLSSPTRQLRSLSQLKIRTLGTILTD